MLLFMFGVVCGVVLVLGLLLWWAEPDGGILAGYRARQDVADIERQTVQRLMAVEMAARRSPAPPPAPGTDVIEGTARDVDRRQP